MHAFGLRLRFLLGALVGLLAAIPVFVVSLVRGARAFHPRGTVCRAEVVSLDEAGARLAGPARVRLSGAFEDENAPDPDILGMAIQLGDDQHLPIATFESFGSAKQAMRTTDVADYLGNQYASVSPWRADGLGVVWFRGIPGPRSTTVGTRVERLDADIAAGRATVTLEARRAPGPDGEVCARLAELRLVERLPEDDRRFRMSMFATGRGLVPTGFRNGVRAITYPASRLARRLRGG